MSTADSDLEVSSTDIYDVDASRDQNLGWADYEPFTSLITWMARGGEPDPILTEHLTEKTDTESFLDEPLPSTTIATRFMHCVQQAAEEAHGAGQGIAFNELSETKYMSIHANTIRLYCRGALERKQVRQLEYIIAHATNMWMMELLSLPVINVVRWCRKPEDATRLAIHAALLTRYPDLRQSGYKVFEKNGPPLIYTSSATSTRAIKLALQDLCLPYDCVRLVNCVDAPGFEEVMDTAHLQQVLKSAVKSAKTPLMVIANVGTDLCGHIDDTGRIRELASKFNMWMHVQGTGVAACASNLSYVPRELGKCLQGIAKADSVAATPSSWFDLLEPLSCVSFRPPVPASLPTLLPVLAVMPLWIHMQQMGSLQLVKAFSGSYSLVYKVASRIVDLPSVNLIGPWLDEFRESSTSAAGEKGKGKAEDAPTKASLGLCVLYEYKPAFLSEATPEVRAGLEAELSKWQTQLYVSLQDSCSPVLRPHIDSAVVNGRTVLRFHPGEVDDDHVGEFVTRLASLTYVFDSILLCQDTFALAVGELANFEYIPVTSLPRVAGLGAMKFKPDFPNEVDSDGSLINATIANKLARDDDVFSPVSLEDGSTAILLGVSPYPMLPERVSLLVETVRSCAETEEESPEQVENLERAILEGIKKAEEQVQQSHEEQFYEEGIVRNLPLIGSLWSWVAPLDHQPQAAGVTFDLSSRQLNKTDQMSSSHPDLLQLDDA